MKRDLTHMHIYTYSFLFRYFSFFLLVLKNFSSSSSFIHHHRRRRRHQVTLAHRYIHTRVCIYI